MRRLRARPNTPGATPTLVAGALALLLFQNATCPAAENRQPPSAPIREILVPFEDLHVLLEQQPRRVMLTRPEYDDLLKKARQLPAASAPLAAVAVAAEYEVTVGQQRAEIAGTLLLDVLEDGLYAVPLDLSGVGLTDAKLDGRGASLGRRDGGPLQVFVEGKGRHELALKMVAPVQTTAAQQVLTFRLPRPAAARMRLTAPGDVEIRGGAAVVRRTVDAAAGVTRFELLPAAGQTSLAMSLNSHLQRQQRSVVARSVLVHEIGLAGEKLRARVTAVVLHGAVDQLRFGLPQDLEVTDVACAALNRWEVKDEGGKRLLLVQLREPVTDNVLLELSAVRKAGANVWRKWQAPRLEPLDVVGQVAAVGLLLDDRLKIQSLDAADLIAIDAKVLEGILPGKSSEAAAGPSPARLVAAYYAPQAAFSLGGRFEQPPATLAVTTKLSLTLADQRQEVDGGFTLAPDGEKLLELDFAAPAGWHVDRVAAAGQALAFERYAIPDGAAGKGRGRFHVRLPNAVAPGQELPVQFHALRTPAGWLGAWKDDRTTVEFPAFAVLGADRDVGALTVEVRDDDDLAARIGNPRNVTPLDDKEKQQFGLRPASSLAYRYETPRRGEPDYRLPLVVERTKPRVTAKSYSFVEVAPEALRVYAELIYDVADARTPQLAVRLPKSAPAAITIKGLNAKVKEYAPRDDGGDRVWTVLLGKACRGEVRLAVSFSQPLPAQELKGYALPVVRAADVAYQSGAVAVEGNAELNVEIATAARRIDVGEIEAEHAPGRRLLGVFGFAGDPPPVAVDVRPQSGYRLPTAIIERAVLDTHLAADGQSQTEVRLRLRTKAQFLELRLPEGAELWSVVLGETPLRPQRDAERLLIGLPAAAEAAGELKIVYALAVRPVALRGKVHVPAPKFFLPSDRGAAAEEIPLGDVVWRLHVPGEYEVTQTGGTLATDELPRRPPAPVYLAGGLYVLAGGVHPLHNFGCGGKAVSRKHAKVDTAKSGAKTEAKNAAHESPPQAAPGFTAQEETAWKTEAKTEMPEEKSEPVPQKTAEEEKEKRPDGDSSREKYSREPIMGPITPRTPPGEGLESPTEERGRKTADEGKQKRLDLEGFRSLSIDLGQSAAAADTVLTFRSLGEEPELVVTLAHRARFAMLRWGLGLAVLLFGAVATGWPARRKARFIVAALLVAGLVPVLVDSTEIIWLCDVVFFAVCALVPYYLLVGAARRAIAWLRPRWTRLGRRAKAAATVTTAAIVLLSLALAATAAPPEATTATAPISVPRKWDCPPLADLLSLLASLPLDVPADAIIVPYDPSAKDAVEKADRLLVPYAKYVELWNRVYPDKQLAVRPAPAAYAFAGAAYRGTLAGDEHVLLTGRLEIDVLIDGPVAIPLPLGNAVLAKAELDGKPARLSVAEAAPPDAASLILHVAGKGRHALDLSVRLRLARDGGWRVAKGVLPAAPAAALALSAPQAQTEVRLDQASDRQSIETQQDGQQIDTALDAGGALNFRWRPKVAEARVESGLTARADAVLDVQEDDLRLAWHLVLEFRRGQREQFSVEVPAGYLVENVEGSNVRGWDLRDAEGKKTVEIVLLAAAKERAEFTVRLSRRGAVGQGDLAEFDVPAVVVPGAVLDGGELTIRRSPLVALRTVGDLSDAELKRRDLPADATRVATAFGKDSSPSGIEPFQAYRFLKTPFALRLAAGRQESRVSARIYALLKIGEYRRDLETQINLQVEGRPLHRVELLPPEGLTVEQVRAPGKFQWAAAERDGRPLLTVYLTDGQSGDCPLVVGGTLGPRTRLERFPATVPLPQWCVVAATRQEEELAVQPDPAFDLEPVDLGADCRRLGVGVEALPWLNADQRATTRLALQSGQGGMAGQLRVSLRKPEVTCETISNLRVTDRAVEDAVLLEFGVRNAGIRDVAFLLPAAMKGCRIRSPLLRQQTTADRPDGRIRVGLSFQDEVMGQLRVTLEHDRPLTGGAKYAAAVPEVETCEARRRYVCLQAAGRDEVVVRESAGVQRLVREQADWRNLEEKLGNGVTQAYLVTGAKPDLVVQTEQRNAVETAGARIGLAETALVLDAQGAYRAEQRYKIDNQTEQYLEVRLPDGAALWTARVDGAPVKPAAARNADDEAIVRIPLVKTAAGDLDYEVVLRYGGKLPPLGRLGRIGFPLMHAVNVRPESSQVRLYVPKDYRWLHFGGTMRRAESVAELAAGEAAYQSTLVERLTEILRSGSEFDKVRARNNLRQLGKAVPNLASPTGRSPDAPRGGESASREAAPVLQLTADNRATFQKLYDVQNISRSKNVIVGLGGNWLKSKAPKTPDVMPDKARQPAGETPGDRKAGGDKSGGGQPDQVARYEERLEKQQPRQGRDFDQRYRPQGSLYFEQHAQDDAGFGLAVPQFGGFDADANADADAERKETPATGLSSLELERPIRDDAYRVFLFTTPRGEVEIDGWAVSGRLLQRLEYLAALAIAALLVLLAVAAVRGRWLAGLHGRHGSTLLIVAGLLGTCGGVLPVLALVVLSAGIVIKLARVRPRRHFAPR